MIPVSIILEWLREHWPYLLMLLFALAGGKTLSDEITLRHPRGKAAQLARTVLGLYFALFFYGILYYLFVLRQQIFSGWP
ncbi:MAG: hypothetical protein KGZ50_08905 [Peptococcaceae bacterium]|nr:hypothetical protein [Peptococcaceae bacterium]